MNSFPDVTGKENPRQPECNPRVTENIDNVLDENVQERTETIASEDSILFVRLSAIGDVVRALPVAKYLRNNGFRGTIDWAVHPPCDNLLKRWPLVDQIHTITREDWWKHPFRLREELKLVAGQSYDWCFDFHSLFKSSLVVKQVKNGTRVGFHWTNSRELNFLFQDTTIDPLPENFPRILKYLALLRGFTPDYKLKRNDLLLDLPTFNDLSDEIKSSASSRPILVHPRTSHERYGQRKEWGTGNFVHFVREILDLLSTDQTVLVTWGPEERETASEIAEQFDDSVRTAPKTPDLRHLVHLIGNARIVVSGDTAPCHLSDVLGVPLIALFGGSNHHVSGPLLTDYRLITCRAREERTGDIPVRRVLRAFTDLLRNGG